MEITSSPLGPLVLFSSSKELVVDCTVFVNGSHFCASHTLNFSIMSHIHKPDLHHMYIAELYLHDTRSHHFWSVCTMIKSRSTVAETAVKIHQLVGIDETERLVAVSSTTNS